MRLALAERFRKDVRDLGAAERAATFEAILSLPKALGAPHERAGLSLRKLHARWIWEARIGLSVRIVFLLDEETIVLVRAGSHDDVRRYLKSL